MVLSTFSAFVTRKVVIDSVLGHFFTSNPEKCRAFKRSNNSFRNVFGLWSKKHEALPVYSLSYSHTLMNVEAPKFSRRKPEWKECWIRESTISNRNPGNEEESEWSLKNMLDVKKNKTIKTLSCCCCLIDRFMWGNLYHSNITLVARNNTSRWMDGLIFRADRQ